MLVWTPFLGIVGIALTIASARLWFVGELLSHFRFAFGVATLAVAAWTFALCARRVAFASVAIAAWGAWPEARLLVAASPDASVASDRLTLVAANVLRPNARYDEVLSQCLRGDPDVIGLLEVSPEWRDAAEARLGTAYPHVVHGLNTVEWNRRTWGLVLYSKRPFTRTAVRRFEAEGRRLRPAVEATVEIDGAPLTIQLVHPERPGGAWRLRARRKFLEELAGRAVEGHRVALGDFNTTTTSPVLADFLARTDLVDSRSGFGRLPTWTFSGRVPGPVPIEVPHELGMSVAIDHAFVDPGLVVLDRETRALPGSDHRAVALTVARRPSPGQGP